jgi:hypothetical protein
MMKKAFDLLRAVLDSWWFIGAVGWIIVIRAYPIETVLPRYAG